MDRSLEREHDVVTRNRTVGRPAPRSIIHSAAPLRWAAAVASFSALSVLASCTAPYVVDEWRTGLLPKMHVNDRMYDFTMKVVDDCGHPIDGLLVRLRGVRRLNGFRDHPESEFYLFSRSGDGGQPGFVQFRFPAPEDPRSLDLYAVLYENDRDVHSTHYYPGTYWYLKAWHDEIDLSKDRRAHVQISPDA